ncbi:MAG: hypothetical protein J6U64_04590 [Alphaproteobacteria bacterium]|nr:hypothetical protein [Alphaproteobacteria bacterium]
MHHMESVPIFIDLKKVEIAEQTNLPKMVKPKTEQKKKIEQKKQKEKPKKTEQKKKTEEKVAQSPKKKETKTTVPEVKPIQKKENIKDSAKVQEDVVKKAEPKPKEKPAAVKKEIPVPKKKIEPPKTENKKNQEDDIDSLLASVEKIKEGEKNDVPQKAQEDVSDLISEVLEGVKNTQTEMRSTKLTVSQIDFIASTVRKYWNLDAGVKDIDNMLIEIKVSLNRDGQVYDVEILNQKRYNADSSFRSVAQSARRAIYICDKLGEDSPFRILALKYPENYSDWQKIELRFNPLDGGVS